MAFRNPLPYALIASVSAFSFAVAAPAPTEQQLNEFSVAFEKAWKAKDTKAILALHELKGLPEGTVDFKAYYWTRMLQLNEQNPAEWGGTKFRTLEEGLKEDPARNVAAYRSQVDDRVINGRKYVINLPVVGFLTLYTAGRSGVMTTAGINNEGQLRIVDHAPADPERAEYRLAAPIPAHGAAQTPPTEEAIARLKEAISKAAASRNFVSLYHTEGAAADLIDYQIRHFNLEDWANREITAIEFLPVAAMIEETDSPQEKAWEPIQYGDRWYGFNLPIAGRVKVSSKPKGGKGWSGSTSRPVGITPAGELKYVIAVPVVPRTP